MRYVKSLLIFNLTVSALPPVFYCNFKLCIFKLIKIIILDDVFAKITFDELTPPTYDPTVFDLSIIIILH